MPACAPWISQAVVPGLSFSSITQRASTPSGPGKVAGPDAVLPVAPEVPGAGLDGTARGAWGEWEQPAMAAASRTVARSNLFGDT